MIHVSDYLTLVEVAKRTGTSKVTARRYLDAGRFPSAKREDGRADGRWLIPWEDVVASGLARKKLAGLLVPSDTRTTEALERSLENLARTVEIQAQSVDRLTVIVENLSRNCGDDAHGS
jgi:predicted site-specific integrase-resolvase